MNKIINSFAWLSLFLFSTYNFASDQLDARKDLTSIGMRYSIDELNKSIAKGDELVVKLFIDSDYPLDESSKLTNPFVSKIPRDALYFFNSTYGSGVATPEKFKKYELLYLDARKIAYRFDGLSVTPLMMAVLSNRPKILSMLIDAGVNINQMSEYKAIASMKVDTALSLAIKSIKPELVKVLLKAGARQDFPEYGRMVSKAFSEATDEALHGKPEDRRAVYKIAVYLDEHLGKANYVPTADFLNPDAKK